MAGRLPVAVHYRLPKGWASVPPDKVKAHSAAFFALHRDSAEHGFAANITIEGGLWPMSVALSELADGSVQALRANPTFPEVEIVERREITQPALPEFDSPAVHAYRQVLKVRRENDSTQQWLIQVQTYQPIPYPRDPQSQAVIVISMTATPSQFERLSGDHEFFLYGVLQRTLGVKYFGSIEGVDAAKVTATANAVADAVHDLAATAGEWAMTGWDTLSETDRSG